MARRIIWNGTTEEALALLQALQAHCECRIDAGRTVAPCAVHLMLTRDQRAIDGLLFMRRMAARLVAGEFTLPIESAVAPSISA
jgi:hypothetical protein